MKKVLASFIFLMLFTFPTNAQQDRVCGPRTQFLKGLERKYDEIPTVLAIVKNGTLLEVVTSLNGGTWSLLITSPNRIGGELQTCMVFAGEDWIFRENKKLEPGSNI